MTTLTSHASTATTVLPAPTVGQLQQLAADTAAEVAVLAERDPVTAEVPMRGIRRVLAELVGVGAPGDAIVQDHRTVTAREVAVLLRRLGRSGDLPAPARRRAAAELAALAPRPVVR